MSQVWIVTVPKNKESANNVYNTVSGPLEGRGSTQTFRFEIPDLVVGTLDSLMALSDDLNKIGSQVENVVRKIERQYVEISADKFKPLQVNNRSVEATIEKFQWDFAAFPNQGKPLSELVATVQNIAGKAEEELKGLSTTYADKNLAYGTAKRRKVINYGTSDFEDFLTPEDVARIEIFNTESLLTLTVVVPKSFEDEFNRTYFAIGNDIASYGGPDWSGSEAVGSADGKFGPKLKRDSVRGSPVVPKSLKLIKEDGESLLYAITVLRGQYQAGYFVDDVFTAGTFVDYVEPLKVAFREKRCIIRELTYDSSKSGGVDASIREAKQDLAQTKTTVLQWCRAHFGEVYNAWLHLKIIQAFVESVLRYGLPIDFVSFFVSPDAKFDKDLKSQLLRSVLSLRPELRPRKALAEDEEEEGDSADSLPYVYVKFALVGGAAPSSS